MIAVALVLAVMGADAGVPLDGGTASLDAGTAVGNAPSAQMQLKLQQLGASVQKTYGDFIQAAAAPTARRGKKSQPDRERLLVAWREASQSLGDYDDFLEAHQKDLAGFMPNLTNLRNARDVMQRVLALAERKDPFVVLRGHSQELFSAMATTNAPEPLPPAKP